MDLSSPNVLTSRGKGKGKGKRTAVRTRRGGKAEEQGREGAARAERGRGRRVLLLQEEGPPQEGPDTAFQAQPQASLLDSDREDITRERVPSFLDEVENKLVCSMCYEKIRVIVETFTMHAMSCHCPRAEDLRRAITRCYLVW